MTHRQRDRIWDELEAQHVHRHQDTDPIGHTSLPLICSVAEVFSCPHTHEYSPASSRARPQICSSHTVPSCLRLYLSPSLRVSDPFLHCTGAALLSSHLKIAVSPSVASWLFKSSINLAGRPGKGQASTENMKLSQGLCVDMEPKKNHTHCSRATA